MSRKTYLQCVNSVLRRLRRSEVGSVTDSAYSSIIGAIVNQAIEHIEGEHRWSAIYQELSIPTVAAQQSYSITGWQDRGYIERIVNTTNSIYKLEAVSNDIWLCFDQSVANNKPSKYRLISPDSSGDPRIELYPVPDAVYSLTVSGYVGQGDISTDSTLVLVPSEPVVLRALAEAIRERGEDGGTSFIEARDIAEESMQKAIDADQRSRTGDRPSTWELG